MNIPGENRDRRECKGARPTKDWRGLQLGLRVEDNLKPDGEEEPTEKRTEGVVWVETEGSAAFREDMFHVANAVELAAQAAIFFHSNGGFPRIGVFLLSSCWGENFEIRIIREGILQCVFLG